MCDARWRGMPLGRGRVAQWVRREGRWAAVLLMVPPCGRCGRACPSPVGVRVRAPVGLTCSCSDLARIVWTDRLRVSGLRAKRAVSALCVRRPSSRTCLQGLPGRRDRRALARARSLTRSYACRPRVHVLVRSNGCYNWSCACRDADSETAVMSTDPLSSPNREG